MYQRIEPGFGQSASAAALSIDQIIGPAPTRSRLRAAAHSFSDRLHHVDWVPDLGVNIGSFTWFRGLATCTALCATTWMLAPGLDALPVMSSPAVSGDAWEETRAQSVAPLAWGGDSGKRMAANQLVRELNDAPERPTIDSTASLGRGDSFARVLERNGVGSGEAASIRAMVAGVTNLDEVEPGTILKLTLGRRTAKGSARPVESLSFRARFDLALSLVRQPDGRLMLNRIPIAVNKMPLRIRGSVGDSLYRSARAAGAPPKAVESYIRAIASKLSLGGDVTPDARFDLIVEQERAETGEVRHGKLLYAGLEKNGRNTRLLQWTIGGRTEWFEASGVGQRRGGMTTPVAGARVSSRFGMRFHPILGYSRLHRGTDFAAPHGSPIRSVTDGIVNFSGRHGGNGNFVRIAHSNSLATSYSHMSQILVSSGQRVLQGQVIGYVGSTGLSTGPHLHFEVYKNNQVVNPQTVSFESASLLSGNELASFQAMLARMLAIPVSGN